ncbi:hypothetical protein [Arvimicrobium flavum]|uniref:hypothetical protein n=1 Tax=Arvimicrobium flavum TaxID=3393320 RepID=UPI00237B1A75|nr:hypothetical protein [Mesorhizobium shangrilense]
MMQRVLALILAMILAACGPPIPEVPEAEFAASDAHFLIGSERVILPFVAVRGASGPKPYRNDAFHEKDGDDESRTKRMREAAGNPHSPMPIGMLEVSIRHYAGEMFRVEELCPLLRRQWAKALCRGERVGIIAELPQRFYLVGLRYLSQLEMGDQIAATGKPPVGSPKLVCDRKSEFCKAAVAVSPDMLAVWTVWSNGREGVEQMAERQGSAISKFVRDELGKQEVSD